MKDQEGKRWVNSSYGPGGILLWGLLAAWFIIIYAIYYMIYNMSVIGSQKPLVLLYFVLAGEVFIAIFFIIFLTQSIHTIYSIILPDECHIDAKLFFGRNKRFKYEDIKKISSFMPKGICRIYTPFESGNCNYKVEFHGGEYIFVSGKTRGVARLVDLLNDRTHHNV